jgi:hypothetical protein
MIVKIFKILLLLSFAAPAVLSQDSSAANTNLKAFTGKRVILKIDMPATLKGVDVWPEKPVVPDPKLRGRKKAFGVSLNKNTGATVTDVLIAVNQIGFLLEGGGFGTSEDMQPFPLPVKLPLTPKSDTEIRLEIAIKDPKNRSRIPYLNERLIELRNARRIIDQKNSSDYNKALKSRLGKIQKASSKRGSRFNIRLKKIDISSVTPDDVMKWLEYYVDFSSPESALPADPRRNGPEPSPAIPAREYWGDWRNSRGETLHIEKESLRFVSGAAVEYKENFRLSAEHFFIIETVEDRTSAGRFMLLKVKNRVMTLLYFSKMDDLQDGKNKNREETRWLTPTYAQNRPRL